MRQKMIQQCVNNELKVDQHKNATNKRHEPKNNTELRLSDTKTHTHTTHATYTTNAADAHSSWKLVGARFPYKQMT